MNEKRKFKRFLVFCFSEYYPCGGLGDIQTEFDNEDEALVFAKKRGDEYTYVFDRVNGIIIYDKDE